MAQSSKSIPPVNQYEFEREFYEFIQRAENRGFNSAFARERGDAYESHVSRMHSPHVPETPSWLYEAAVQLDKAARVNSPVAKKALAMLAAVVNRHGETNGDCSINTFSATFHEMCAVLARRDDGVMTEADVEAARDRHAEATARVGARVRLPSRRDVRDEVRNGSGR